MYLCTRAPGSVSEGQERCLWNMEAKPFFWCHDSYITHQSNQLSSELTCLIVYCMYTVSCPGARSKDFQVHPKYAYPVYILNLGFMDLYCGWWRSMIRSFRVHFFINNFLTKWLRIIYKRSFDEFHIAHVLTTFKYAFIICQIAPSMFWKDKKLNGR